MHPVARLRLGSTAVSKLRGSEGAVMSPESAVVGLGRAEIACLDGQRKSLECQERSVAG